MLVISDRIRIPESDLNEEFIRSTGPGGQNVNKVSSAVQLRFDLEGTRALPAEVKERLRRLAGKRLTESGEIVITARAYREQERNRKDARKRLSALIVRALEKPKARKPTRRTRSSQEKRLKEKKAKSETKRLRQERP